MFRRRVPEAEILLIAATLAATLTLDAPALAHSGTGGLGGFLAGASHPLLGLDHLAAMLAVGLWGALLGLPAIWLLPLLFPLVMAAGGVAGIASVPLPGVETGIALSAAALGLLVALAARPPLWIAALLVGGFAILHGHAHGAELPPGADALAYSLGFVVTTGLLHLAGIAFGSLSAWPAGRVAVRVAGGAAAAAGAAFLWQAA